MHVIRLPVVLDEVALPSRAEIGKYGMEAVEYRGIDTSAPVLRDENEVKMKAENAVISGLHPLL